MPSLRFFRRKKWDEERARELEAYIAIETEENIARGMSPEEAHYAARRKLGNLTRIREKIYEMNSLNFLETLWQDIRYGLRMLRKNPGFTAIAILTLALGIGANTAIFSVVNAILLRPLPYPDSGHIAYLGLRLNSGDDNNAMTVKQFSFLRDNTGPVFESIAGYRGIDTEPLQHEDKFDWVNVEQVTDGFFDTLGVKPAIGRAISRAETQPGSTGSVILTDELWRRSFGANSSVLGSIIKLGNTNYVISGVLPRGFKFIENPTDVFIPLELGDSLGDRGTNTEVIARLKPDVTFAQVQAAMNSLYPSLPDRGGVAALSTMSYQQALTGDVRSSLLVLAGAVGLLLLIACTNVANLNLSRASMRTQEMSIRLALGAGRGRLLRQLLTESFILALAGAIVGVATAYWILKSLVSMIPWNLPSDFNSVRLDLPVLLFALAAATLTSIVFGLASFRQVARVNINETLKESGKQSASGAGRARNILVVCEMALSLALLVGAVLLSQTFYKLRSEKLGFDPANLITFHTNYALDESRTPARQHVFEQEMLGRLESLPGVSSAATVNVAPLTGQGNVPAQLAGNNDNAHSIGGTEIRVISPRYFETMHIPMLQGRGFRESDSPDSQPVAVINETLARRWWNSGSPLGDSVVIGKFRGRELFNPPDPPRQVVGVVGDVKGLFMGLPAPPMIYIFAGQDVGITKGSKDWVIRTAVGATIGPAIRSVFTKRDPSVRVSELRSMRDVVGSTIATQSFDALLTGIFAVVALVLAAVGIYGVLSLFVGQRTHEIGIRMALGATPMQVLLLVMGQGLALASIGITIGTVFALWLTRFLRSLLFEIKPTDPITFGIAALTLAAVALLACYIPARRAMKVDPMVALRYE